MPTVVSSEDAAALRAKVGSDWADVLPLIPGYDPFATAAPGDWFDEDAAIHVLAFVETHCRHVKGEKAGETIELEPWQVAIVANLFGWKRENGSRRYRECLIYVPRKNGKTSIVAAILLYLLAAEGEGGAEIYIGANDLEQASITYDIARQMVELDPTLSKAVEVQKSYRTFEYGDAIAKALTGLPRGKHGKNPSGVIIDELHEHRSSELVDTLVTGTGARRQPVTIYTTTADINRPGSICNKTRARALRVRDGKEIAPSFLPVVYETEKAEDWLDPDVWAKANPNLGVSVSMEYLETEAEKARNDPLYENEFRRLHLNQITEQEVRLIPMAQWDECSKADLPSRVITNENGRLVGSIGYPFPDRSWLAIDVSSTQDFTALAHVAKEDETGRVFAWLDLWIPEKAARDRERKDGLPLSQWAERGDIRIVPGAYIDHSLVRARVLEIAEAFPVVDVAFDPWNAQQLATELSNEGLELVKFGQGMAHMNEPTKELLRLVGDGLLVPGSSEVLRWMASNTAGETDGSGNVRPSRKRSLEKIDGIVALVMAIGRMLVSPNDGRSVYEESGVLVL